MSRGPGRWQRAILDNLAGADSLVLVHRARSHSERVAILRAAHALEQRGMIQLASEVVWGRPHLVAWAVGATPPESVLVVGRDGKTYRRPSSLPA
ncbi:hypothetical protein [Dermacoccus sp. BD5]|uniref:hypothetical protein n=1 Tax=Dermacoccus sp. BD5 TaxID=2953656 RepID=UPI0038420244